LGKLPVVETPKAEAIAKPSGVDVATPASAVIHVPSNAPEEEYYD
jgi:hypothetical protein